MFRGQVTLAVLVCSWAHVLHGVYKPWGTGSAMYNLQHGSLLVTAFVFLMGLLFKVRRIVDMSVTLHSRDLMCTRHCFQSVYLGEMPTRSPLVTCRLLEGIVAPLARVLLPR